MTGNSLRGDTPPYKGSDFPPNAEDAKRKQDLRVGKSDFY